MIDLGLRKQLIKTLTRLKSAKEREKVNFFTLKKDLKKHWYDETKTLEKFQEVFLITQWGYIPIENASKDYINEKLDLIDWESCKINSSIEEVSSQPNLESTKDQIEVEETKVDNLDKEDIESNNISEIKENEETIQEELIEEVEEKNNEVISKEDVTSTEETDLKEENNINIVSQESTEQEDQKIQETKEIKLSEETSFLLWKVLPEIEEFAKKEESLQEELSNEVDSSLDHEEKNSENESDSSPQILVSEVPETLVEEEIRPNLVESTLSEIDSQIINETPTLLDPDSNNSTDNEDMNNPLFPNAVTDSSSTSSAPTSNPGLFGSLNETSSTPSNPFSSSTPVVETPVTNSGIFWNTESTTPVTTPFWQPVTPITESNPVTNLFNNPTPVQETVQQAATTPFTSPFSTPEVTPVTSSQTTPFWQSEVVQETHNPFSHPVQETVESPVTQMNTINNVDSYTQSNDKITSDNTMITSEPVRQAVDLGTSTEGMSVIIALGIWLLGAAGAFAWVFFLI